MLDFIAHLFLVSIKLIASVLIIGYLVGNKEYFLRTLFVFAFTMILNTYLKYVFQVYAYPGQTGYNWVFPSGHMQTAFAFWGWLAIEYRNKWFTGFVAFLLSGVAWGLIYFDFHSLLDVLGAIAAALLTFVVYYLLQKIKLFQKHVYLLGYFLLFVSIPLILLYPSHIFRPQVWIGVALLSTFPIAWIIQARQSHSFSFYQNVLIVALAVLGVSLIGVGTKWVHHAFPFVRGPVLIFSQYALISLWVGAGVRLLFALLSSKFSLWLSSMRRQKAHG